MYFIFCSFGENKFIMVNWQFYGEDKKNTPPQSPLPPKQERSKFKWTGIPIVILIGVGMMKFIGGEMKNNPTNSFIKEPVFPISPVNFIPTNNDYIQKTSPNLKSIIPESDFKFNTTQYLKDFSKFRNSYKDIKIDPIKSDIMNYDIPPTYISNETNLNINTSLPNINIIPKNSILNQQNSFDSKTKINGSLD